MDRKSKFWIIGTLLILGIAGLGLFTRASNRNIIFIVDTSGSMTENKLIGDVKQSIRRVVLDEASRGDQIHLFTFDSEIREHLKFVVGSQTELSKFFDQLDQIKALGQWTDLVSALDRSLQETVNLLKNNPGRKTKIVLYTDGVNDPPPGKAKTSIKNFNDLLGKYYDGYSAGKSWFIYYVELNQPDQNLRAFLEKSKSGKTVPRDLILSSRSFLSDLPASLSWVLGGLAGLLGVLFGVLYLLPWFHGASLEGAGRNQRASISLDTFKKPWFSRQLKIGGEGDIRIVSPEIARDHARIGVDLLGKYYMDVDPAHWVMVEGKKAEGRVYLKSGQKVIIGAKEFVFQKKNKAA